MYTESTAFIQFLQIIGLMACITLEMLAFVTDLEWRRFVERTTPAAICSRLMKTISPEYFSKVVNETEGERLADDKFLPLRRDSAEEVGDQSFLRDAITRQNNEEVAAIVLIFVSLLILTFHLIVACVSKNYQYRTKWTGAAQGTVIFCCGFAAIFLSIGAHFHDSNFEELSERFGECQFLLLCKENRYLNPKDVRETYLPKFEFPFANDTADKIRNKFKEFHVCQDTEFKIAAAALCGVIIAMSMTTICLALDLTTLYDEEDIDEEEKARRKQLEKTGGIRPSTSSHMSVFKTGSNAALSASSTAIPSGDKEKDKDPKLVSVSSTQGVGATGKGKPSK